MVLFSLKDYSYFCGNRSSDLIWKIVCLLISLSGLFVRIITVGYIYPGTSGRNTKYQEADNLNTSGIYSVVRNPLYLGNIIMYMGTVFVAQNIALAAAVLAILLFYYERIIYTEECFLAEKYGAKYAEWANNTPLLVPDFAKYRKSDLKFNWKLVLRKEFSGVFAVAAVFFMLDSTSNFFVSGKFSAGIFWTVYLAANLVFYAVVLCLKKRTAVLK